MSDWKVFSGGGVVAGGGAGGTGGTGGGTGTGGTGVADRATFFAGFGNPILPGVDLGARHVISQASTPGTLYCFLNNPPAAGDFTFTLSLSVDSGVTWTAILNNPISINSRNIVTSTDFVSGITFAAGNMLRLDVISSGLGPGFSNGFQCALSLNDTTAPAYDRATFWFGIATNPPIAQDMSGYYIVTRTTTPDTLYVNVKSPPSPTQVMLDFQVLQNGVWTSILTAPIAVTPGLTSMLVESSFATVQFNPGDLIRPYMVSGPPASGMGYNAVLEMTVN